MAAFGGVAVTTLGGLGLLAYVGSTMHEEKLKATADVDGKFQCSEGSTVLIQGGKAIYHNCQRVGR